PAIRLDRAGPVGGPRTVPHSRRLHVGCPDRVAALARRRTQPGSPRPDRTRDVRRNRRVAKRGYSHPPYLCREMAAALLTRRKWLVSSLHSRTVGGCFGGIGGPHRAPFGPIRWRRGTQNRDLVGVRPEHPLENPGSAELAPHGRGGWKERLFALAAQFDRWE